MTKTTEVILKYYRSSFSVKLSYQFYKKYELFGKKSEFEKTQYEKNECKRKGKGLA